MGMDVGMTRGDSVEVGKTRVGVMLGDGVKLGETGGGMGVCGAQAASNTKPKIIGRKSRIGNPVYPRITRMESESSLR
jgi:hypothetical protein